MERHRIHVASSVKFPQSVMIWAAMSSAGVGLLCFLKSTVNAAVYQEILEHPMPPSADKLYGDADFIFQQDLVPAHTAKGTKSWFNDYGVTVLDWPANSPDLNPIENLWGIVKRKMKDTRPSNARADPPWDPPRAPCSQRCFHFSFVLAAMETWTWKHETYKPINLVYRFILFYFVLYICIYVAPWSCEARHLVPLYVHTCSGMTIKLNLTWLDLMNDNLL